MDQGVHILDKGAQTIDLLKNTIAQPILHSWVVVHILFHS